jgi:hypothetical protein
MNIFIWDLLLEFEPAVHPYLIIAIPVTDFCKDTCTPLPALLTGEEFSALFYLCKNCCFIACAIINTERETHHLFHLQFFDSGDCRLLAGGSFRLTVSLFINFVWQELSYCI